MSMIEMVAQHGHKLRESVFVGTSVAGGVASLDTADAYNAVSALINLYNSESATVGKVWLIPVFIKLVANAVNTTASNMTATGVLDIVNRHTGTTGTTITPVVPALSTVSGYTSRTPKGVLDIGLLTLIAANTAKIVFDEMLCSTIFAVDDAVEIWFGSGPSNSQSGTQSRHIVTVPPVYIGPGANFSLHEIGTAQAADPKFEIEICWIETGHDSFGQT